MFMLALETALRSIRKTPGVSALVVLAIALGVGITMPMVVLYHNINQNPMPDKSDQLYTTLIYNWFPEMDFWWSGADLPPDLMTAKDARALSTSDIPDRFAMSYNAMIPVRSSDNDQAIKPFFSEVRVTSSDFFEMFEVPIAYGGYWDDEADRNVANVAVINPYVNERLFGGGNNVGRSFKISDQVYEVIGILDAWNFTPRLYALGNNSRTEGIFVPVSDFRRSHLTPSREVTVGSETPAIFDATYLASETLFADVWVELDSPGEADEWRDFVDSYVLEQKQLGRLQRPMDNRVISATDWLNTAPQNTGSKSLYRAFIIVAGFFLVVCIFNLLSLLLSKFMSVASEASVTRALGATRSDIFLRYVLEVMILGLIGGALSLYVASVALRGMVYVYIENLPSDFKQIQGAAIEDSPYIQFDMTLLVMTFVLALAASIIAALIPAWRACSAPPAEYLKVN
ncbi:MAG: ABC transporter permease [Pseudomonadales bacterium]|nr:ABC transporter permease [Pseudomonadales bacterium]MBO6659054.1 ABC transporter permease [Pseudomonadales bacterium]